VFIVGSLGNGRSAEVLFEREGVRWNPPARGEKGEGVANTLAGGSSKCHADISSGQQDGNVICWEMQHATEAYREAGDIAPNLQSRMGTGGNNVPLVGVRRLTPTECEALQGFPRDWTFGSDSTRYKQLGNAVAVPVAEWIGKRIMALENP